MNQFEASILLWIQENLRGLMDGFWVFVTHLGDGGYLWIALGIVLLFFKKTRPIGFTVLISLLINFIITNITLKDLIARPRPFVVNDAIVTLIREPKSFSFPSGHTSASFAAMLALSYWVPKKVGIPAIILASMIAFSRMYIGVHYPTDILGGILVGFMSSIWAYYLVRRLGNMIKERKTNG